MQFACAGHIGGGGQCLDLFNRHIRVGGVEVQWVNEMFRRPLDESIRMIRHRCGGRPLDMLEDRVEDRASVSGEIGHKLSEFPIEVTEK